MQTQAILSRLLQCCLPLMHVARWRALCADTWHQTDMCDIAAPRRIFTLVLTRIEAVIFGEGDRINSISK